MTRLTMSGVLGSSYSLAPLLILPTPKLINCQIPPLISSLPAPNQPMHHSLTTVLGHIIPAVKSFSGFPFLMKWYPKLTTIQKSDLLSLSYLSELLDKWTMSPKCLRGPSLRLCSGCSLLQELTLNLTDTLKLHNSYPVWYTAPNTHPTIPFHHLSVGCHSTSSSLHRFSFVPLLGNLAYFTFWLLFLSPFN